MVDALSDDKTMSLLESYPLEKTRIISEEDNGIFDALNKGIKNSSKEYICFLHSDDEYSHNTVLEDVFSVIDKTDADIVYANLNYVAADNTSKILREWKSGEFYPRRLQFGWMPPHPTFFMKRELYHRLGVFDIGFKISADYDAMLRYLKNDDLNIQYLDKTIVNMSLGGNSTKMSNVIKKKYEDFKILRRNDINPIVGLVGKNISKIKQIRRIA